MRAAALVVSAISFLLAAHAPAQAAQSLSERAKRDEVKHMAANEPAMRRAMDQAKATLDNFLRIASAPPPGTTGFALKVAVSDKKNTEYFWVGDFLPTAQGFEGTLSNEPRLVKKYYNGERFEFSRAQVVDWVFRDENRGRMLGNYTGCALLTKEPPAQAKAFQREHGLQCD
ncbi:DUF2314 domain-containing protein [Variovorax robiniae]|uniref:DUF2314 domain-containing protein n=1 Tax=Variovorax robiniae TaxID=1836199 RepID=A0ABU8X8A5_9BURK